MDLDADTLKEAEKGLTSVLQWFFHLICPIPFLTVLAFLLVHSADIVVDNCAICRNHIMDLCTTFKQRVRPLNHESDLYTTTQAFIRRVVASLPLIFPALYIAYSCTVRTEVSIQ